MPTCKNLSMKEPLPTDTSRTICICKHMYGSQKCNTLTCKFPLWLKNFLAGPNLIRWILFTQIIVMQEFPDLQCYKSIGKNRVDSNYDNAREDQQLPHQLRRLVNIHRVTTVLLHSQQSHQYHQHKVILLSTYMYKFIWNLEIPLKAKDTPFLKMDEFNWTHYPRELSCHHLELHVQNLVCDLVCQPGELVATWTDEHSSLTEFCNFTARLNNM